MIIYRATNLINYRQYIGRTVESLRKRRTRHSVDSKTIRHLKIAFHNAIRKYGIDAFMFETLESCLSMDSLLSAERRHIAEHRDWGVNLYNMTEGGDGSLGLKHSDASKQKLRTKALARNLRTTSARCRPCVLDGIQYPSVTEAARQLDTSRMVVQRWLRLGKARTSARRSDYRGFEEPFAALQRYRAEAKSRNVS